MSAITLALRGGRSLLALGLVFLLAILPGIVFAQHSIASWKTTGKKGDLIEQELIIEGKSYGISAEIGEGTGFPSVKANRTPEGAIIGSYEQVTDGAYMMMTETGFAVYNGKLKVIDGAGLLAHAGEYALFLPLLDGMDPQSSGCDHATLYCLGRTADVGFVRRAKLLTDGTAIGWYPVVDGKPYRGGMHGDDSPADTAGLPVTFKKRYFKYKNHMRVEGWSLSELTKSSGASRRRRRRS
jgi:hypothetical protein